MLVHQLVTLPSDKTRKYLSEVFSGCSFDLDLDLAYVEINSSILPMQVEHPVLYTAQAGTLKEYYDSATGETSLLLPLSSDGLVERCREVRADAPSAFYSSNYFPFLVLKRNMTTLKRHRRGLLRSYSDILAANVQPMIFDLEFLAAKEFDYIPDMDYYVTASIEFTK